MSYITAPTRSCTTSTIEWIATSPRKAEAPLPGQRVAPLRKAISSSSSMILRTNTASPLGRSEEHTSELQSLMRISYAVFRLKKHTRSRTRIQHPPHCTTAHEIKQHHT